MPDIYLVLDGKQQGPYQPAQIRQLLAAGQITAATPAWYVGLSEWSTVEKIVAGFPSETVPPPFAPLPPQPPAKKGMHVAVILAIVAGGLFVGLFVISCLAGIALGPITNGIKKAKENASMQVARQIDLALFAYSVDHNGTYPAGKTSTEVFQKLIDEKYISDPGTFYLDMPGKTRATSNQLTAENVCFDVTNGVTADSPDDLPIVFTTGYNMTYAAGSNPSPDTSGPASPFPGIAVAYKSNSARFFDQRADGWNGPVIPASFDAKGSIYQQLKP